MTATFLPILYGLAGVCGSIGAIHAVIAWRKPARRVHLLFAALCMLVVVYVVVKAAVYQAAGIASWVELRRWEVALGLGVFIVLPWLVAEYTGVRRLRWLGMLTLLLVATIAANFILPHGVQIPGWLALALSFAYCSYACWRQYRHGEHHRAWTLAFGLALLLGFVLFDRIANAGFLESAHLAQFGFVALVVVMGVALFRDLGEADRRMQSVLDNVPAVIFLKDFAGRYVFVNRRFEERFGVSAADAAGHTDFELFPKAQAEAGEESDCLVLKNRMPLAFDEVAHHDGRSRTYFTLKFPLLDEGREAYGVGCVSTDVTEARAAVEEARMLRQQVWHAERVIRVSAMGASLAHELSQPLTAILSNAQAGLRFLAKEDFNPGEFQELLRDVVRDAGRASSLISGLRNMLRKKELPRERLDLAETAAEALKLLNQELLERSIEYRTELEAGCAVLAAKAQLQQVLLNLLMNAAEAVQNQAAGRRRVTVAVSTTPAGVARVMIRDTGVGIPADELRGVFDAFYSTKPTGIGMGLAVCRAIIDTHGGKIWAERNEDGGATIVFTLPLALEARALATGLAPSDQVAQASPA